MFIQIEEDLYINTDRINFIRFVRGVNLDQCQIKFADATTILVSDEAGSRLLLLVEATETLTKPEPTRVDLPSPATPKASLKTKIAQGLRDLWKGVTVEQLAALLNDVHDPSINLDSISFAVNELENERVAVRIPHWSNDSENPTVDDWLIYHASDAKAQAYLKTLRVSESHDPAGVSEALPDAKSRTEYTES